MFDFIKALLMSVADVFLLCILVAVFAGMAIGGVTSLIEWWDER